MYIIKEKNLKDFWFLFVFISFFEPNYFVYIPILHIVCQAITIFAFTATHPRWDYSDGFIYIDNH